MPGQRSRRHPRRHARVGRVGPAYGGRGRIRGHGAHGRRHQCEPVRPRRRASRRAQRPGARLPAVHSRRSRGRAGLRSQVGPDRVAAARARAGRQAEAHDLRRCGRHHRLRPAVPALPPALPARVQRRSRLSGESRSSHRKRARDTLSDLEGRMARGGSRHRPPKRLADHWSARNPPPRSSLTVHRPRSPRRHLRLHLARARDPA